MRAIVIAALAAIATALLVTPAFGSTNPSFALGPDGQAAQIGNAIAVTRVCTGDFNGDGSVDVAAAVAPSSGTAGVYVANGDGTGHLGSFTFAAGNGAAGAGGPRCAAADFNGDGRTDLATTDRTVTGVTIALGQANGTFSTSSVVTSGMPGSGDVAVGDFNGDGKADLAVGIEGALPSTADTASSLAVLLGDGAGGFAAAAGSPYPGLDAPPDRVIATDLNADGHSDVLVRTFGNTKKNLFSALANPDGSLQTPTKFVYDTGIDMAPGVVDGDGKMDIVYPVTVYAQVSRGNGSGVLDDDTDLAGEYPSAGSSPVQGARAVALADFNNDGLLDIALGDAEGRSDHNTDVWTMAGNGATTHPFFDQTAEGPFVLRTSATNSLAVQTLVPVDINGDGRLDLVAGTQTSTGTVGVLLNNTPVPTVVTGPPSSVGGNTATVTGTIGTSGLSTAYGVDLISASGAVTRLPTVGTLSGSGTEAVSIPVSGLSPDTIYRYRAYATNANGTTVGQIRTFRTGPGNTSPPQVTGTAATGQVLTCDPGTWIGSPTFSFQWLRGGVPLSAQTGSTYTVTSEDFGATLVCRVTGANANGSSSADSPGVAAVAGPSPPSNLHAPQIIGTAAVGQTVACAAGDWSAGGTFAYQWLRDGSAIAGATQAGYKVVTADATHSLKCRVTVTNPDGSASAESAAKRVPATDCVVPRLRGKTVARAKRLLVKAGCRAGRVTRRRGTGVRRGRVLRSSPKAGTHRPHGTKVKLVVRR